MVNLIRLDSATDHGDEVVTASNRMKLRGISVACIGILMLLVSHAACSSTSIFGSAFDYTKAKPTSDYFSGKSRDQIVEYCKNERLGTMELSSRV